MWEATDWQITCYDGMMCLRLSIKQEISVPIKVNIQLSAVS
ncbi:MAG: hypothetical protein ABIJ30_00020 [bacterium]